MRFVKYIVVLFAATVFSVEGLSAQTDRHDIRSGNRKFNKGNWNEADIAYRKAIVKDSTSIAANYNLANTLYRQENYEEAAKYMEKIKETATSANNGADYWFNTGDIAIARKNWQAAVDAFKQSLLKNPGDITAKENYIYAKKMLENQKNNDGGNGGNDNQEQKNQDRQNQQDQQNSGDKQDQNKNGGDNDRQNQDRQNQEQQEQGGEQPQQGQNGRQPVKISPQQAQQLLKAIQAKEKETQDKVNKEKADALKSRQKERNW